MALSCIQLSGRLFVLAKGGRVGYKSRDMKRLLFGGNLIISSSGSFREARGRVA